MKMKYGDKHYNEAMTKVEGEASRKKAIKIGGWKAKGGKPVMIYHGKDAKVVGHN